MSVCSIPSEEKKVCYLDEFSYQTTYSPETSAFYCSLSKLARLEQDCASGTKQWKKHTRSMQWRIQGECPVGTDPPFQTWRLFETEIPTSTASYITLADLFRLCTDVSPSPGKNWETSVHRLYVCLMKRALHFATKLNFGDIKNVMVFGICSSLLAKQYFPRQRWAAFTDWETRGRLCEK